MREIEFRGKRRNTGEWVYGDLIHSKYYIFIQHDIKRKSISGYTATIRYDVIPETVGQYTGIQDKNGMRIFEGDILLEDFLLGEKGAVYWHKECTSFHWGNGYTLIHNDELAVVGNIHDNAELLEG